VYLIKAIGLGLTKIGVSSQPRKRINQVISTNADSCELIAVFFVNDMKHEEIRLHSRYAMKNAHHEWFKLSACDIEDIKTYFVDTTAIGECRGDIRDLIAANQLGLFGIELVSK